MKITITRNTLKGSIVLTWFLIIAACVVLTAGGCVAYKVSNKAKKLREFRERQLSNELSEAKADLMKTYVDSGGNPSAQTFGLILAAPYIEGQPPALVLQSTTNLSDWEDAGSETNFGAALAEGYTNGVSARFFRLRTQ